MKKFLLSFLGVLTIMCGCGQKSDHHGEHDHSNAEEGGNQVLYEEVMKVHDEVMPKMNDLYKLREQLKKQIADAPDMAEQKKKTIESVILRIDSASEGMMDWMRNFNPLPDSLGEEKARDYLVDQKEKVNKVKEEMLQAIDEAKALN